MSCVADLTLLIGLEEQFLAQAFICIDPDGSGVVLEISSVTNPSHSGSKGRHIDDDATSGVGRFADAHGQHIAKNLEVFDGPRQGK